MVHVVINKYIEQVSEDEAKSLEEGVIPEGLKSRGNVLESHAKGWYIISKSGKSVQDRLREMSTSNDNYSELKRVLEMAYNQASEGKGKERHANGEKFEDQPIMTIAKGHGLGYQTGQAAKKLQEAHTLLKLRGKHAAIQEILGAINYAAAAVLLIEQMEDEGEKK